MCFNSTVVRLIAGGSLAALPAIIGFQFHRGTIDRHYNREILSGETPFQFHRGTIDSFLFSKFFVLSFKFQFHRGTIDSLSFCHSNVSVLNVSIPPWYD